MNARSVRNDGVLHALTRIRLSAGAFTMAIVLGLSMTSTSVYAQQTAGAVYGKVAAGTAVTVESVDTGAKRSVTASADGSYRVGALPPGAYKVSYNDGTATVSKDVQVAIGSSTLVGGGSEVLELEKFVVGGLSVNPIDFGNMESVSVFNEKTVDLLPIARNTSAIALLAPGTTQGDTAFGNLISFGGASVAENAYFVNGFNLSNFRNGLAPANVPFEFYDQFEIKTGGYSAEFGRSTGGVINATTKSGTNDYKAGANVYFTPDAGRSNAPSSYFTDGNGDVVPNVYNGADYYQEWQANIYASGALWKDKLFFYGIHQWSDYERRDAVSNGTRYATDTSDAPFWGAKLDFFPINNHHFEYTTFTDKDVIVTQEVDFDHTTNSVLGTKPTTVWDNRGGRTHIARYTGTFFEDLTVSALWGNSTQDRTRVSSEDLKDVIYDGRSGSLLYVQGNPDILYDDDSSDERTAKRLDAEYSFELAGTHRLRAGLDIEDNESKALSKYSGGGYLRYYTVATTGPNAGKINGTVVPGGAPQAVRKRTYQNQGAFQVKSEAWYVEDNWTLMSDRLNLRLGLRNETFENLDAAGDTFIKVTGQKAPRISATYDLTGNKKTKVFANYGRYHLPVASNTNIRLAGGENFIEEYYVLTSVNADGTNPVLGAKIGPTNILADGTIHDRREIVDMDIAPMYQDEYIVGFQHALNKEISIGARFTHRLISGTAMDDMIVDHALTAWAQGNGFPGWAFSGAHAYVLANPGRPIRMFWDFSGNGTLEANEEAVLTPELLGYPSASRTYYAMEVFAEKIWDGKWSASASYTWAQSFGNYEGWVLSDNGQDDAGLTILFDTPMLANNTRGYLANDRRHQFKVFGAYALTPEISIGTNISLTSGRPLNKIGTAADPIGAYGAAYLMVPRGSAGTSDWVFNTNLSLVYRPKWGGDRLTLGLDVFNVLNGDAVTEQVEYFEDAAGGPEYSYGAPSSWQRPRYFRLSVGFDY